MRELLHSRSGHGKHHHRSEADHRETTKAAAWAVFQHHGGGGVHRHNLYRHAVRRATRFKIEAQMKHAMAHHSTSHMPTDAIHVNWDAGSTLFDSFELDSLCKQLGHSFHPAVETPHPPNSSSDETDHPEHHAYANPNPNPNLGPRPYPRPAPQHGHPGLHDPTEDADAQHYQVGRGVSLVDGVLVPITVRGSSYRLTRNGRGHGDGHGSGMHKDDDVGKLDITGHGHAHAHAHGHHHHGKLANVYRWWKEHHHKHQPSEKTSSDDESATKDEFDDLHPHDHHKSLKWKLTHLFHHSHHHHHDHHDVSLHMLHGAHKRIAPHDVLEKGHKARGNHIIGKLLDHSHHKHHHHHHHHHGDEGNKYHYEDTRHGGKHNASARKDLYIAKDVDLPRDHHKWQEDFDHHDDHHHHLHLSHALKSGLRMVLPRALCRSVHLFRDKDDSDLEDSADYDFHHHLDHHSLSNNKGDLHHNNYNYGNDHDGSHIVHEEEEGRELEYHHDHHRHYHHHHVHHREEKHDYELTVQAIVRRVPRKSFEQMARRLSIEEIDVKAPRNSLENFEERVQRSSGEDQCNSPRVG